ncbi:MAG: hypothetical protein QOD32_1378 [Pyrinomonadaceae bacterium]|nr:hypothetical protein [Pyrinomonadaceae bacterium]
MKFNSDYDDDDRRKKMLLPETTKFADVQQILDEAVEQQDIGIHGPFWRGVSRDEFVVKEIFGCLILHQENETFNGPQSPLVKILRARIECGGGSFPQMPAGIFSPIAEEKIQTISDWIDAQCPE